MSDDGASANASPGPAKNTVWRIAFGDYDFAIDRKALTYDLTETKTGTVWAEGLSVGWVELEDRATGAVTRHDFGQTRLVSLSEKSGSEGKRVLFGLDVAGIPIDIYIICSKREIQTVVEANRDSPTHRIHAFGLFPGLVSVPDDGTSYLVLPQGSGVVVRATDVPEVPRDLPVWGRGLIMPFIGAVRSQEISGQSAVVLITDSAYASARRSCSGGIGHLEWVYSRDPERRRLDVRCVVIPHGDYVSVARAYRDKIIAERNHVTLRKKMRERPTVESLIGAAGVFRSGVNLIDIEHRTAETNNSVDDLRRLTCVDRAHWLLGLPRQNDARHSKDSVAGNATVEGQQFAQLCATIHEAEYLVRIAAGVDNFSNAMVAELAAACHVDICRDMLTTAQPLSETMPSITSRWADMDARFDAIEKVRETVSVFGSCWGNDWSAVSCDFWWGTDNGIDNPATKRPGVTASVPLQSIVYRDSVVCYHRYLQSNRPTLFLRNLFTLDPPSYVLRAGRDKDALTYITRTFEILSHLHRLTFTAFIVEHRFLTPDFKVEEAVYSDKTRVVINQSETEVFETDDLTLPPMGFYVRHVQMEAHDALRVGDTAFETRSWRIRRARDGKPLESSEDVLTQEFPI